MLIALLLGLQATPEGVAERDTRELAAMLAGRWNNAEAVSFAGEMGKAVPTPLTIEIEAGGEGGLIYREGADAGSLGDPVPFVIAHGEAETAGVLDRSVHAVQPCAVFGAHVGSGFLLSSLGADCEEASVLGGGYFLTQDSLADGTKHVLYRADPYACWVSRKTEEGEGAEGWTWTPNVSIREGEYVQLSDVEAVGRPVGLKLRHVRWPYGRNRDSLVLYVHEAEDAPAISYAWTEPDADRIAINLRWAQASCTRVAE